jgi:hypothetical protein
LVLLTELKLSLTTNTIFTLLLQDILHNFTVTALVVVEEDEDRVVEISKDDDNAVVGFSVCIDEVI